MAAAGNAIATGEYDIFSVSMRRLVEDAWALKGKFDLSSIGYGKIHWGDRKHVLKTPFSYYYFLAGMTRLTQARRIVEVGTHQGGSSRALAAGAADSVNARVVTFDVTDDGARIFAGHPIVKAYTVDANSERAFEICLREFGEPRVDLVFIDTTHDFWPTVQSFMLYAEMIQCPLVLVDDITLNERMTRLWDLLRLRYGADNTVDATEVDPEIRSGGDGTRPGFGVVRILPRNRSSLGATA